MINPNDPANPTTGLEYINQSDQAPTIGVYGGLTIRAELAARAMQGIIAHRIHRIGDYDNVAIVAVKHADALINELNKTETNESKRNIKSSHL